MSKLYHQVEVDVQDGGQQQPDRRHARQRPQLPQHVRLLVLLHDPRTTPHFPKSSLEIIPLVKKGHTKKIVGVSAELFFVAPTNVDSIDFFLR